MDSPCLSPSPSRFTLKWLLLCTLFSNNSIIQFSYIKYPILLAMVLVPIRTYICLWVSMLVYTQQMPWTLHPELAPEHPPSVILVSTGWRTCTCTCTCAIPFICLALSDTSLPSYVCTFVATYFCRLKIIISIILFPRLIMNSTVPSSNSLSW